MSGPTDAPHYSLSSLNWIEFGTQPPPRTDRLLEDIFDAAVAAGFQSIGLDLASAWSTESGPVSRAALVEQLQSRSLSCSDVGILFLGLSWTDDHANQLAQLAADLGASTCLCTFAGPVNDESLGQLRRGAGLLSEVGVRLALEYIPFGALRSVDHAAKVCAEIGWEHCGLLLDSYHVCRSGLVTPQLSGLSAEQISLVQLADGGIPPVVPIEIDARRHRRSAGYGDLAVGEFVTAVRATGWNGVISPEVLAQDVVAAPLRLTAELLHATARLAWESPAWSR